MRYNRTHKKTVILLLISIVSMLVFSNFDLTKELQIKGVESVVYFPVPVLFPIFFIFLYINIHYIQFSYREGKSIIQKVIFGLLNMGITISIFVMGFEFWKLTQGDIDVAFFGETKDAFKITFRNIFFWTFYQTLLMTYGLSVLKIMVSRTKK